MDESRLVAASTTPPVSILEEFEEKTMEIQRRDSPADESASELDMMLSEFSVLENIDEEVGNNIVACRQPLVVERVGQHQGASSPPISMVECIHRGGADHECAVQGRKHRLIVGMFVFVLLLYNCSFTWLVHNLLSHLIMGLVPTLH